MAARRVMVAGNSGWPIFTPAAYVVRNRSPLAQFQNHAGGRLFKKRREFLYFRTDYAHHARQKWRAHPYRIFAGSVRFGYQQMITPSSDPHSPHAANVSRTVNAAVHAAANRGAASSLLLYGQHARAATCQLFIRVGNVQNDLLAVMSTEGPDNCLPSNTMRARWKRRH